ncbi:hypothetical protein APY04_1196 [Hyphomicrobium sulfonivorans]|uniref:Tat pathway signal sequence domain protein n=1 Tax=Hyphomicrobium sulfonivorans TaxID=121290 RepID=A0A120CWW3_HYPSL|nr:hypothetical protein [Hyphomicrobium sulfonivorans]KWT69987.1 hypothetical protein APY04_1196 [Hyphomicrobium sulfonivorans]
MKFSTALAAAAALSFLGAIATAHSAAAEDITLELNKLEKSEKGCRAYIVVSNPTSTSFDTYKLDLVLFQTDGVIGRRLALDLAPVRADKRTVKLFDLEGTDCDGIGSFLVNDVLDCRTAEGPVNACLAGLKVRSLTKVDISK